MKISTTLKLSCLSVAMLFGTSLVETTMADRGKSSPKIAHGMYRDRGKSSPKIAHRTRRAPVTINVVDMVDVYFDLLDIGEYELADEVGMEVEDMVREMGYWRGGR